MQRPKDGSGMTEFWSFDNSTCKRVLGLLVLEPGDLRLGQVVIKRVAVVKLAASQQQGPVIFFSSFKPIEMPLGSGFSMCRGKSGPALGGTEYRLMPSACRLIVRAKL